MAETGPSTSGPEPRLSRMAVAAAVSSAILCCPLTSIVGIVLGWRALRLIDASAGTLRGRGLALLALLLGGVGFVVQFHSLSTLTGNLQHGLTEATQRQVRRVFDESTTSADVWEYEVAQTLRLTDVESFTAGARARYGPLRGLSISPPFAPAGASRARLTAPVAFIFENEVCTGGVTILAVPRGLNPLGEARLVELIISDPGRGDLVLPPPQLPTP